MQFLFDANLVGTDNAVVSLGRADLTKADLRSAVLLGANLREAKLAGADLTQAPLWGADLSSADLSKAQANEETIWPESFDPAAAGVQIE